MFVAVLPLILASASPAAAEPPLVRGPVKMKPSEIRAYNANLSRDHPNYIRCERVEETGSLVRKVSVCRTNEEWGSIESAGNQEARDAVEGLQKGFSRGN